MHMLIKQSPSLPRNMALGIFGKFPIVFSAKGKYAMPPLFNGLEVLSSASNKAELFSENFFKNSNLDD